MTAARATVLLVRHCRTPLNAAGVLRGRIDIPLDPVGRAEARALGAIFGGIEVKTVVSSPLARARATAAAIARTTGADADVDDDLADRDFGRWAGTSRDAVEARFGSLDAAPGVEPAAAVIMRAVAALERAADRGGAQPVVVVAHDAVIRLAMAALVPTLGAADDIPQRTGCWNRLDHRSDGWAAPIVDAVPDDGRRP